MKNLFFIISFLFVFQINSQTVDLSSYKYIIVASNFGFLKSADAYQTSSLTKFLLQKKEFQVFLDTENFPQELQDNRCLALQAKVLDDSGMFTTKNFIQFTDCSGKIIYTSQIGSSKEKDYQKAYHEAIRKSFDTMTDFTYTYNPTNNSKGNDKLQVDTKMNYNVEYKVEKINFKEVDKSYSFKSTENGFELLDAQNQLLFKALKTSLNDVYVLENKKGIIYKKDKLLLVEYYENNVLVEKIFEAPF